MTIGQTSIFGVFSEAFAGLSCWLLGVMLVVLYVYICLSELPRGGINPYVMGY
jgi:hypothetical protein